MRAKLFFVLALVFGMSQAQEIRVKGGFIQDSLKIGMNVEYWMSARYPSNLDLLLPDSNFNFSPYEFGGRKFFETTADSTIAFDSVVYSLQSFEIDKVQFLQLPATIIQESDSSLLFTDTDSIYLIELVPVATDTTALIANTDYQKVKRAFNSPLAMIIVGTLLLVAIIVLIVFGKKIRRHFKLKRMAKSHATFIDKMASLVEQLKKEGTPPIAENALTEWKSYMEKLEKKPFTKLTSKELTQMSFAQELKDPLKAIDRCVYGKISSDTVYQDFQHLEDFTVNRYQHLVECIKHGQ